jgi:hypothetical protein
MTATGTSVSLLKFVGTVSLGLLTVCQAPSWTFSTWVSSDIAEFYKKKNTCANSNDEASFSEFREELAQ